MLTNCDANATFGVLPAVLEGVCEELSGLGNPSSIHRAGQRARAVIEEARDAVRAVVGAGPRDLVIWTSGATEANNLAIRGFARVALRRSILTSPFEHPAVLETVRAVVGGGGATLRMIPTQGHELSLDAISELADGVGVVSLMLANNETGVISPMPSIVATIRRASPGALIHVDAVQAVGRIPVSFSEWGVDAVSLSGHKLGAFSGVGALVMRAGLMIEPEITGGSQEEGLRAGTQPVPAIVSLLRALSALKEGGGVAGRAARMAANRAAFLRGLGESGAAPTVSPETPTLPNTISLRVPGVAADDLVVAADIHGVLISSGAACSSGTQRPSPVLLAAGLSEHAARETIRVSVTDDADSDQFYRAGKIIAACIARLSGKRAK